MKVTLLGDSIRQIGYGTKVPALLGEGYEVFQPEDNCRFAQYTYRMLFDYEQDMSGTDIVHWNNGLWDICNLFGSGTFTGEEAYVDTMLRIADILQKRYKKVIFATTTPVRAEHPHNSNADIQRFNGLIVPKLQERGILINDLHSLVTQDVEKYILESDCIHLSEEGIDACSKQVAKMILTCSK